MSFTFLHCSWLCTESVDLLPITFLSGCELGPLIFSERHIWLAADEQVKLHFRNCYNNNSRRQIFRRIKIPVLWEGTGSLERKELDIAINSCHVRKKWLNLKFHNFISKHLKCINLWLLLKLQWSNSMMSFVYLYAQLLGTYYQSCLCKSVCPDHTNTWMVYSILYSNSFGFSLPVFAFFSHTLWDNKHCYNIIT